MISFDAEEVDEALPPARPAPDQHLESPRQRLDRMVRQHADLIHRRARSTDVEERERLQRLIRNRAAGLAYQRSVVARLSP